MQRVEGTDREDKLAKAISRGGPLTQLPFAFDSGFVRREPGRLMAGVPAFAPHTNEIPVEK